MEQITYVIVFIVRPARGSHELLLARRAEGKYMGGTWQLIAGKLEPRETLWQAAVREMREETGLEPVELYRLSHVTTFYRNDNDSLNTGIEFCAIVPADAAVALDSENTDCEWMPRDQVRSRLMWASDQVSFDEVCSVILDDGPTKAYQRIPLEYKEAADARR